MQIFDSYIEAGQKLAERDKRRYYTALIEYLAYGRELPDEGPVGAIFAAIMPTLEASKARSEAGRKGGKSSKQLESKPEANAKQTPSKPEANREANAKQAASKPPEIGETNSKGNSKEKELPSGSSKKPAPAGSKIPPTPQQVAEYANGRGTPIDAERFCDYFAQQGWRLSNGNPMKDWQAAVRNWASRDSKPTTRGEAIANASRYGQGDWV